jgi:hypothetical protein
MTPWSYCSLPSKDDGPPPKMLYREGGWAATRSLVSRSGREISRGETPSDNQTAIKRTTLEYTKYKWAGDTYQTDEHETEKRRSRREN